MNWLDKLKSSAAALTIPEHIRCADPGSFHGFYDETGEYYERLFAEGKRDDIEMYLNAARRCGGPVIEAACGNGRVALPLAKNGFRVVGCDLSSAMLRRALEMYVSTPGDSESRLALVRASMAALPFRQAFALALIPYNSFNHLLEDNKQNDCLDGIRRALFPGGMLMMEILPYHARYYEGFRLRSSDAVPGSGRKIAVFSRVIHDRENSIHTVAWYFREQLPDGKTEYRTSVFRRRDMTRVEVCRKLEKAGFAVESVVFNYAGERDPKKGVKVVITAVKRD